MISPEQPTQKISLFYIALIFLFVLATRIPYWHNIIESNKDAHKYVTALELDQRFDVPPPGHIGSILVPRVFRDLGVRTDYSFALFNLLCTLLIGIYSYLLGRMATLKPLAACLVSLLVLSNSMIWYYSVPVNSYLVWPAFLLMIAYHGWVYWQKLDAISMSTLSLVFGIGTILRPDLLAFAGPLFGGMVLLAPKWKWQHWLIAAIILAGCNAVWFFLTATLKGGITPFLQWVREKHEFHESFGVGQKGLFEGLVRNLGKYGVLLLWTTHLAIFLLLIQLIPCIRSIFQRPSRKFLLLALLAIAPSLYFAWIIFMGNHGLIFPILPLLYLLLVYVLFTKYSSTTAGLLSFLVILLNILQFAYLPMKSVNNQRDMILNVMFLRYTADGLDKAFLYNLADFNIEENLNSVLKQLQTPQPMPKPKDYLTEEQKRKLRGEGLLPAN